MEDQTVVNVHHKPVVSCLQVEHELKRSKKQGRDESAVAGSAALLSVFVFVLLLMQWNVWPKSGTQKDILKRTFPGEVPRRSQGPVNRNETSSILALLSENGTKSCHNEHTNYTSISGLDFRGNGEPPPLSTDTVHKLVMVSHTADGRSKCSGGDFYEIELRSERWQSRPPVDDFGDGSYGVTLFVDSAFEGLYNFSATLLFDCFHGLEFMDRPWDIRIQTVHFQISFYNRAQGKRAKHIQTSLAEQTCRAESDDFQRKEWQGKWTRSWVNDSCSADADGRFATCVPLDHEQCSAPCCSGRVSRLESNSWVYSAHCGFHIFEAQEAWDCLSGKWLLFWGDSNFQDTIRNLMLFVLGVPVPYWSTLPAFQLPRQFEEWFVNPNRPDQALHVSMIFNGHYEVYDGDLGLDSLQDPQYREWITRHFTGTEATPDTVIMNSGLHDGNHFKTVGSFVEAVDRAISFWKELLNGLPADKHRQLIYRTTVAPAGESRGMQSNPHKMEIYNKILVERLQAAIPSTQIVDAFDLTFPFHYDNNYSDGGHYGRAPNVDKWPWFGRPHHYFVDLMLVHMLLNAICPT